MRSLLHALSPSQPALDSRSYRGPLPSVASRARFLSERAVECAVWHEAALEASKRIMIEGTSCLQSQSFYNDAAKVWNGVPNDIKECNTLSAVKNISEDTYKHCLFKNAFFGI